jgi:hypothetical protein
MILAFLAAGWGPVFIADLVRTSRPDLSARYVPQAFAMSWLVVVVPCSLLAALYVAGYAIRLVILLGKQLLAERRAER